MVQSKSENSPHDTQNPVHTMYADELAYLGSYHTHEDVL